MNISQQFAPPFKLVGSFFISAMIMFFISILLLFNFDINLIHTQNSLVLSWVHLYLLGFVMMSIFASMAQLLPVVLEVEDIAILGDKVGFSLEGKVNRQDFDLKWNKAIELGGVAVSDEVKIKVDIEAKKQ